MRFVRTAAVAMALAAVAQTALAAPQPAALFSESDWQRLVSPDGRISAMFPCAKAEASVEVQEGGFAIECRKRGLRFVMTSGLRSIEKATAGQVIGYDALLAKAKEDLPGAGVQEAKLGERRSFTIICPGKEGVACMQVVDLAAGKALLVGALEEGLDPALRPQGMEAARKFYESLEIKAQ